jgi:hypothetical protein
MRHTAGVVQIAATQAPALEDHLTPSKSFGVTQEVTMIVAFIVLPVLSLIVVDWALSRMRAK